MNAIECTYSEKLKSCEMCFNCGNLEHSENCNDCFSCKNLVFCDAKTNVENMSSSYYIFHRNYSLFHIPREVELILFIEFGIFIFIGIFIFLILPIIKHLFFS